MVPQVDALSASNSKYGAFAGLLDDNICFIPL